MKKKKVLIPVIASLVTVLVLGGVSYAYYSAKIKENNKTETVIKSNVLGLEYTGVTDINVEDIVPGDSFAKTFTVKNTSNREVNYNIYMENITNEFNEDLVYTLTDENGEVVAETKLPETSDKSYLKTNVTIDASKTKTYTLKIEFKYTNEDQSALQGKTFKATVGIDANKVEITPEINAFETDSWETIQQKVQSGNYEYKVGDTKTITLASHTNDCASTTGSGASYVCNSQTEPEKQIQLRVANVSPCTTETSESACGFVVEFAEISENYKYNKADATDTSGTNVGGWPASEIRTYINGTIYKALPTDLQNVIVDTKIISSGIKIYNGYNVVTTFESTDKLYLLSEKELRDDNEIDKAASETKQLDYYKNLGVTTSNYIGTIKRYNDSDSIWWSRTSNSTKAFIAILANGEITTTSAKNAFGVSPAFRIG